MRTSDYRSPAVPRRRFSGRALVALVSTDATGVAATFVVAALADAAGHPHDAFGTLLVALVGFVGVALALVAVPLAVRSIRNARRAVSTTNRATALIAVGLLINTVGSAAILAAYSVSGLVGVAALLLLVVGDVLSVLYLVVLRMAHHAARRTA